jgi:hypothetical protein
MRGVCGALGGENNRKFIFRGRWAFLIHAFSVVNLRPQYSDLLDFHDCSDFNLGVNSRFEPRFRLGTYELSSRRIGRQSLHDARSVDLTCGLALT